jgi:aspartokinase/homoserine dehydrogenase 1
MVLNEQGRTLADWRKSVKQSGQPADLDTFVAHVHADHFPHAVILDCTSSAELTKHYPAWLERGIHIITPNKKANTSTMEFYRTLRASSRSTGRHYLYETTVGAGLPIINTLRDLVQTGDRVLKIEGVLSGTLSYIFNTFDGTRPFSEIVIEAKGKGYTEPDPRDDLSGMDVARKLVILAREMGLDLELQDIRIESLVPESLRKGSIDQFLDELPRHDKAMTSLVTEARGRGEVLRYVGLVDPEGLCSVALKSYPRSHAFAGTSGSDNIVAFTTERYHTQSLVVQGPGAGPEVTAGGVFADLLRLASYVGVG